MKDFFSWLVFLLAFILNSCNNSNDKQRSNNLTPKYMYVSATVTQDRDTVAVEKFRKPDSDCFLLKKHAYLYKGIKHELEMFIHDGSPIDDEYYFFLLDSTYSLYEEHVNSHSGGYRLMCSNDSINTLLMAAREQILISFPLKCFNCEEIEPRAVMVKSPNSKND